MVVEAGFLGYVLKDKRRTQGVSISTLRIAALRPEPGSGKRRTLREGREQAEGALRPEPGSGRRHTTSLTSRKALSQGVPSGPDSPNDQKGDDDHQEEECPPRPQEPTCDPPACPGHDPHGHVEG